MKLYYKDQYMQDFQTVVNRNGEDREGYYVVLQETAFYPTGGGQPHDTGMLNHFNVVNVEEVEGEIRHYIDGTMQPGDKVAGKINWKRRFDHMQQHTGQHILTAAFEELYQFETLSFHLGTDTSTIDLNTERITEEELFTTEARCNEIILENLPIQTKWINEGEIRQYPLRKMPSIKDNIRLVIIPNVDYNACGGTHPTFTGEVMGLKILHWERQKRKVRIHFVCGHRVIDQLHEKNKVVTEAGQLLNSPGSKLAEAVSRLVSVNKELEKKLMDMEGKILEIEGQALIEKAKIVNDHLVVTAVLQNRTMQELQKLGKSIVEKNGQAVVIAVSENGEKMQLVCGRGNEGRWNMQELMKELLPLIDGKGGGSPVFVQGGGTANVSGKELLDSAFTYLHNKIER